MRLEGFTSVALLFLWYLFISLDHVIRTLFACAVHVREMGTPFFGQVSELQVWEKNLGFVYMNMSTMFLARASLRFAKTENMRTIWPQESSAEWQKVPDANAWDGRR